MVPRGQRGRGGGRAVLRTLWDNGYPKLLGAYTRANEYAWLLRSKRA